MAVNKYSRPSLIISILPLMMLFGLIIFFLSIGGADCIQRFSWAILLFSSLFTVFLSRLFVRRPMGLLFIGIKRSLMQVLPAIPLLLGIGLLATTWMAGGVIPYFISLGISYLSPTFFLPAVCGICALVSVATGSSWTTIATLGIAFMGIGDAMGVSEVWTAGAIISGAYFGDKISPLSDTTVLASSTCGISLLRHIRNLMVTTTPSIVIAMIIFTIVGLSACSSQDGAMITGIKGSIENTFNLGSWQMLVPLTSLIMLCFRVKATITIFVSSLLGFLLAILTQPTIVSSVTNSSNPFLDVISTLWKGLCLNTGDPAADELITTSGVFGMAPTILLVITAMIFGGVMIGSGMLTRLSMSLTRKKMRRGQLVTTTVGSGLLLNSCTGDQYLSIILGGHLYSPVYRRNRISGKTLSRSLEDSVSVTSVLIPWNSCGMAQSAVLGVATFAYLPYCIFNLLSPVMSVIFAYMPRKKGKY